MGIQLVNRDIFAQRFINVVLVEEFFGYLYSLFTISYADVYLSQLLP